MVATKIKDRQELSGVLVAAAKRGRKIGYTSGVFDLLHAGHVDYLEKAREQCDILVVGVNSDESVRELKGNKRPINSALQRMTVLAGLGCIDYVFEFSEANNNLNVELLRPHIYFKAGDYSRDKLSSASIVEKNGGKVVLIKFSPGQSSTSIIERIVDRFAGDLPRSESSTLYSRRPAIFVDRDGTINEHVEHLHEAEKFKLIPNSLEGLLKLQKYGYRIVVVTNQPGIGMGYFSKEDFFRVNREMLKAANKIGLQFDRIYFCPHNQSDNCNCRKPNTGMIERAVEELNIDLSRSFVIGDMTLDLELGRAAGCRSVLVQTGRGGKDGNYSSVAAINAANLGAAAEAILSLKEAIDLGSDSHTTTRSVQESAKLEAIGKVASRVGHDMNNLLGAIRGSVDLMRIRLEKEANGASAVERQLTLIEKAVVKATQITAKIRGFVRPGTLDAVRMPLRGCVDQAVEMLRGLEGGKYEVIFEAHSDPEVEIGEFHVSQMVLGLCLNALEASEGQKDRIIVLQLDNVHIEAGNSIGVPKGDYARLSITDHGAGVPQAVKEHLFEPFVTTKSQAIGKGLGLTLAMAYEIMKRHQGAITIQSVPQCGTGIGLYFPR